MSGGKLKTTTTATATIHLKVLARAELAAGAVTATAAAVAARVVRTTILAGAVAGQTTTAASSTAALKVLARNQLPIGLGLSKSGSKKILKTSLRMSSTSAVSGTSQMMSPQEVQKLLSKPYARTCPEERKILMRINYLKYLKARDLTREYNTCCRFY